MTAGFKKFLGTVLLGNARAWWLNSGWTTFGVSCCAFRPWPSSMALPGDKVSLISSIKLLDFYTYLPLGSYSWVSTRHGLTEYLRFVTGKTHFLTKHRHNLVLLLTVECAWLALVVPLRTVYKVARQRSRMSRCQGFKLFISLGVICMRWNASP